MHSITSNALGALSTNQAPVLKRKLKETGIIALYVYMMIGGLVALPYLNWQHARQNGFANWMTFGQIVPTVKSIAWPYYMFAARKSSTVHDPHFVASRQASQEAMELIREAGGLSELSPEQSQVVADTLDASVAKAEQVADAYLAEAHPDYPQKFREGYIEPLRSLADGIRTDNATKRLFAAVAFNNFQYWASENVKLTTGQSSNVR